MARSEQLSQMTQSQKEPESVFTTDLIGSPPGNNFTLNHILLEGTPVESVTPM